MEAHIRKFIGMAVLGVVLFSARIPAWAGSVNHPEVKIFFTQASGSMVGARDSGDSKQYIGCVESNNASAVTCLATDKTGKSVACVSKAEPKWAAVVRGITDSSFINFGSVIGDPTCVGLTVDNGSQYLR